MSTRHVSPDARRCSLPLKAVITDASRQDEGVILGSAPSKKHFLFVLLIMTLSLMICSRLVPEAA